MTEPFARQFWAGARW